MSNKNDIIDKYTKYIMNAVKSGNKKDAATYKLIKAKMLEFVTQKNAPELNDNTEIQVLNSMIKERMQSAKTYEEGGRKDLADAEMEEIEVIKQFVPKQASAEEIENFVQTIIDEHGTITQKCMGNVIKMIKEKFKNVDGKLASTIVKNHINN